MSHKALANTKICLVFEHSLSHNSRILDELEVLQKAGAVVELLTSTPQSKACLTMPYYLTKQNPPSSPPNKWRYLAQQFNRKINRHTNGALGNMKFEAIYPDFQNATEDRHKWLASHAKDYDLFWVIDFLSLPIIQSYTNPNDIPIVYETVDLIPEYHYWGKKWQRTARANEKKSLESVAGFITACDSYADYYQKKYGVRPVVRDNMPYETIPSIRATDKPLRYLFFGSLMFDRPIIELIDAFAASQTNATLTIQGKNLIGDIAYKHAEKLNMAHRIEIIEPVPPGEIISSASNYDIGIVALRGENENECQAATQKIFTYMSAGLAILGSNLKGISDIINSANNGFTVKKMDQHEWVCAFRQYDALNTKSIDGMKVNSLNYAKGRTLSKQMHSFLEVFQRALGRQSL